MSSISAPVLSRLFPWSIPERERGNVLTHVIGAILSIFMLLSLVHVTWNKSSQMMVGCLIYGIIMTAMFVISALYHATTSRRLKHRLRVADHVGIFVMIAGTHTSTMLVIPHVGIQTTLLTLIWLGAFGGIALKRQLFLRRWNDTCEFSALALYVFLGLMGIPVVGFQNLMAPTTPILFLALGGAGYLIGVPFYILDDRRPHVWWAHPTWHVLVIIGALFHAAAHASAAW